MADASKPAFLEALQTLRAMIAIFGRKLTASTPQKWRLTRVAIPTIDALVHLEASPGDESGPQVADRLKTVRGYEGLTPLLLTMSFKSRSCRSLDSRAVNLSELSVKYFLYSAMICNTAQDQKRVTCFRL